MSGEPSKKLPLWPITLNIVILGLALLTIAIFSKNPKAKPGKESKVERLEVQKEFPKDSRFILGKFYTADWCIFCQKLKKALDKNPETKDWQEIIEIVDMTKDDENFSESMPVIFPVINGEENRKIKLLSGYTEELKSVEYFMEFLKKALKLRGDIIFLEESESIEKSDTDKIAAKLKWQKFSGDYFYRLSLYSDCLVKREAVLRATTKESQKAAKEAYESALEQYAEAEKKKDLETGKN